MTYQKNGCEEILAQTFISELRTSKFFFVAKLKPKKTSPTGQRCVLTVSLRGTKFALDRWMNRLNRQTNCWNI